MTNKANVLISQEVQLNGQPVPVIKPFAQQMGMTSGGSGYNDMARMAMSHPAFLDQSEKPQVHFGSAAQFQVVPWLDYVLCDPI